MVFGYDDAIVGINYLQNEHATSAAATSVVG